MATLGIEPRTTCMLSTTLPLSCSPHPGVFVIVDYTFAVFLSVDKVEEHRAAIKNQMTKELSMLMIR